MSDNTIFPVPASLARGAWIDEAKYEALYAASMADPEKFWGEQGKRLDWIKPYHQGQGRLLSTATSISAGSTTAC